jgi:hypothetical protein
MKVPNGDSAIVDIAKLREYCLSSSHPRGRHKARVFFSVLTMTDAHAEELRIALLQAVRTEDAIFGTSDIYGTRYIIDFEMMRKNQAAMIRSSWIIRSNEIVPRFVTCFVM